MPRLAKPEGCRGCVLYGTGQGFSADDGHGLNGVLVVAEALGANEEADGLPLRPYAQSGSLFEKALRICGYTREQFRITNTIRCRPPRDYLVNAPYEFEALQHCRPYLDKSIADARPKAILALGGIALRELTGMAGYKQGVSYLRGYVLSTPLDDNAPVGLDNIPVVATFHPSYIRQGKPQVFSVLVHDLQQAVLIARSGRPSALPTRHIPQPTESGRRDFLTRLRDSPLLPWLTYDIETPNSADLDEDERDDDTSYVIEQIQFSLAPGEGIVLSGSREDLDFARLVVKTARDRNVKMAGHYVHLFDDPRLRANGFGLPAETWDIYEMWHHLQPDLAAGLQSVGSFYGAPVPWKHLAQTDRGVYGCWDVDIPQRILAKLPDDLKRRNLWDSYLRRVHGLRPILTLMSSRGIPINDARRVAFGAELEAAMKVEWDSMQQCVPEECRNVHPKHGYLRTPKDTTGMVQRLFKADPMGVDGVLRWCRIEPFTPSPKQLIAHMKWKGHPVPKDFKKQTDTTAAKELERLSRKTDDSLYRRVIAYRELQKMKGTYVDGWKPSVDGRVHTTFTFAPATAQLSSRGPNVQNGPVHEHEGRETGLADKFARCQEAPSGYHFVSFDHKSFHALTLAYLADDPVYERIVRADVHSFLASQFLKLTPAEKVLDLPDDELLVYLSWVKKTHRQVRDGKAKRTILKWGFGGRYKSTYQMYRESFTSETEAKRMEETLESLFPKTVQWRLAIRHEADRRHFLLSPFGFLRWFWEVIDWRPPKSGSRARCTFCGQHHGWGEQSEQAIAYLPANLAFGMMREEMLHFHETGMDERYGYVNTVHDSHVFLCPDALVDECAATVKEVMEQPSPYLVNTAHPGGLWCATSVSVGRNMAARSEGNPDGKDDYKLEVTHA